MKIINKPRQSGKTTELIKLASKGRYKLIVVRDRKTVDQVWRRILELKELKEIENTPPQPITYQEFLDTRYAGQNIESFLIDDADYFLQYLTSVKVEAITLTGGENEK